MRRKIVSAPIVPSPEAEGLRRFIRWDALASSGGVLFVLTVYLLYPLFWILPILIATALNTIILLIALWLVNRGELEKPILMICASLWVIAIMMIYLAPQVFPGLVVLIIWPVSLAVPYMSRSGLKRLMLITSAVAVIVAFLSVLPGQKNLVPLLPDELIAGVNVSLASILTALTLYQLWLYSGRLNDTLEQMQTANEALQMSERSLEAKVVERTAELTRAIRQAEEARAAAHQANQAKSIFLANMSHEIRTPMNGIIGMTSLLLDTKLTQEQREFTEIIRNSGDTLLTIINDILDFSKIEAGKLELEYQSLDLYDCLESALDLVVTGATAKGLDLAYLVDPQTPAAIIGDSTRLRQILVNLLSNAVKFTEQGEVVVLVSSDKESSLKPAQSSNLGASPTGRYQLHFAIRDTGIGIPPERMDRLFRSFSQIDASTTRRYGGTGLGLAISKRLCEMMGGAMWAESQGIGQGSTFHFTIQAEAAPTTVRAYLNEVQPQLDGKRVLIVDDNSTNRRILSLQTQGWGMLPQETASPAEALAWLRQGQKFDLALLDFHMPEMDGLSLAREIRHLEESRGERTKKLGGRLEAQTPANPKSKIHLVLLTSVGGSEALRQGELEVLQLAALLTKPIKSSQLFETLNTVFANQPVQVRRRTITEEALLDVQMGQRLPLRILLAEDNTTNQKLALQLLSRLGYRADLAANGLEAITALARQPYDLVFMDVQMPEMDGLEATRYIRQKWPGDQSPYIIAMTANVMQGDREMCLAAGMNDYISKPIRVVELVQVLSKCKRHTDTEEQPPMPKEENGLQSGIEDSEDFQLDEKPKIQNPVRSLPEEKSKIEVVSLEKLKLLAGEDTDFLAEVIESFLIDAPQLLAKMRQALAQNNAAGLRLAAHSLKSNSAEFGATRLTDLCRELEKLGKAGTLAGAEELLTQAEAVYEQIEATLKTIQ